MFNECGLEWWPKMTTRGRQCPHQKTISCTFLHILSVSWNCLPSGWIVTEAIFNLRDSHNCPRTFDTYFSIAISHSIRLHLSTSCTQDHQTMLPSKVNVTSWGVLCYSQEQLIMWLLFVYDPRRVFEQSKQRILYVTWQPFSSKGRGGEGGEPTTMLQWIPIDIYSAEHT